MYNSNMASRFRCPRSGTRVRFDADPAAIASLYDTQYSRQFPPPRNGEEGKVTSLPFAGKARTCIPGPGGGLVYVNWERSGTQGVFRYHLVDVGSGQTLRGAKAKGKTKRR